MAPSPSKGCPSTDAKTTKPSTSKGGPTKNNKIVTPSIVTDNSKTYSKNEKLTYSYMNYPQKPDKLPVIITQPKDDYLGRQSSDQGEGNFCVSTGWTKTPMKSIFFMNTDSSNKSKLTNWPRILASN